MRKPRATRRINASDPATLENKLVRAAWAGAVEDIATPDIVAPPLCLRAEIEMGPLELKRRIES